MPEKGIFCGKSANEGRSKDARRLKGKSVNQAEESGSGFAASEVCAEQAGGATAKHD